MIREEAVNRIVGAWTAHMAQTRTREWRALRDSLLALGVRKDELPEQVVIEAGKDER